MPSYKNRGKLQKKGAATTLLGRSLPASIDAEKSVLASILLNSQNLTLVSDTLRPADFYNKQNSLIYKSILDLAQENKKIDLSACFASLR